MALSIYIAPAEGRSPIHILTDIGNEAKLFPTLFPSVKNTYLSDRPNTNTLSRYINCRLMSADNRWSKNIDNLFFAQYISELHKIISNVSLAVRKSFAIDQPITAAMLAQEETLHRVFKNDQAYKFLKPVRGTPAFWQAAQKDLMAMVWQLGIPTWFCSFSAADTRWPETL